MSGKGMGMTAVVDAERPRRRHLHRRRPAPLPRRASATSAQRRCAEVMTRTPRTIGPDRLAIDCVELMETPPKVTAAARRRRATAAGRRAAPARPLPRAGRLMTAPPSDDLTLRSARDPPAHLRRRRRADRRPHLRRRPRPRDEGVLGAGRRGHEDADARRASPSPGSPAATRPAVTHRARQLGVAPRRAQGAERQAARRGSALRARARLPPPACAHIGDDLPDVPLFARCGLAIAVPHAPPAVRARAHLRHPPRRRHGRGARGLRADPRRAGHARRRSSRPSAR